MSIGTSIKKIREHHSLSQSEFAKSLGVTDKAVSTWENDKKTPRIGIFEKIQAIYGVPKSKLIDDAVDEFYKEEIKKKTTIAVTPSELMHIRKYRMLDEHGMKAVETLLELEVERILVIANDDNLPDNNSDLP